MSSKIKKTKSFFFNAIWCSGLNLGTEKDISRKTGTIQVKSIVYSITPVLIP